MKKATTIEGCLTAFILFFYLGPILVAIASPLLEYIAENNPFDYAKLTDVDYKAIVVDEPNSNGKIIVTERLTYDIHAFSKNNLFWELWRALPEGYVDGLKVDYKVNSVKQIYEDGTDYAYRESSRLYWGDEDYVDTSGRFGPGKWYHSKGPYDEYLRQYECVLFYVDGIYRDKVTFEIEYEMNNAALRYNDCSELYLCMYSEETIKDLNSFKGQILFPDKDMPDDGNYYAHTYGTTYNSFPIYESSTKNPGYYTFSFVLDKSDLKFGSHNQYLEFALVSYGDDKHIFTEHAPDNMYSSDNALEELKQAHEDDKELFETYKKKKNNILFICLIGSFLLTIYAYEKNKKVKKKYKFYEPETKIHYFRDIPSNLDPNFAADLVFIKHKNLNKNKDGYSAIMLSLVRKGYIEVVKNNPTKDWNINNVQIIIKHRPTPKYASINIIEQSETENLEPLTLTEQYYFNLIIKHSKGNEITMKAFQDKVSVDYYDTNTFVRNIEKSTVAIGTTQGYFQKSNFDEPKKKIKNLANTYMIFGILLLTVVNFISSTTRLDLAFGGFTILGIAFLISSIYLNKASKKYILLTQFGEDEYAKWHGLYNFLNSETLINERTVIELPLWEKYLVYATAFGISKKVIKALNIRCPQASSSPVLNNTYYRTSHFYHSNRSFRSTVRSTSHSYRTGSYSGSYGGFSGGRGGGGGRRRSLKIHTKTKERTSKMKFVLFINIFLYIMVSSLLLLLALHIHQ